MGVNLLCLPHMAAGKQQLRTAFIDFLRRISTSSLLACFAGAPKSHHSRSWVFSGAEVSCSSLLPCLPLVGR